MTKKEVMLAVQNDSQERLVFSFEALPKQEGIRERPVEI